MSLQELTLHGWDIRSSVDPAAGLPNDCLPALTERIPTRRLPWSIPFQTRGASPIRYRFEMTGPGAGNQDIVVEAGKARVEPAGPDGANVTIRCDTGIFVLLMYGRLTLESARQDGRLEVQGEPALTSAFDRWLMGG
ncbi:MAG: SCP2 sterol-binding domain-containing protein [Chloroflexi bacterium]|nr:SCP2 sterol-binding domain-containing protein [Chloroflexota bacterium]